MKTKILLFVLGLSLAFVSCKKDDTTDQRDKYVGTWQGTQNVIIETLSVNDNYNVKYQITKGSAGQQIKITDMYTPSTVFTANVDNTTHIYDKYTLTDNSNGYVVYIEQTGAGRISGNTITENGTIVFVVNSISYYGTWTQTLSKFAK